MALTKAQRARLDKLATYLEGLPADYRHFDMSDFLDADSSSSAALEYARHNGGVDKCGTVACAVGHGPAAGILMPPRMLRNRVIDWAGYSDLFTPREDDFAWCFGGAWSYEDNTHHGAAARIRYLLDKGRAPEGFSPFEQPTYEHRKLYAPYRIDAKVPANA